MGTGLDGALKLILARWGKSGQNFTSDSYQQHQRVGYHRGIPANLAMLEAGWILEICPVFGHI